MRDLSKKLAAVIDLARLDFGPEKSDEDPRFQPALKALCAELGGKSEGYKCSAFDGISVHRTFLWEHDFPPGAKTHVVHDYRITASWNLHPENVFKFDAFCLSDPSTRSDWEKYRNGLRKAHEEFDKSNHGAYPHPREFFTEYVLHTGGFWAGPIRDFELVVHKSSPQQLVFTCFTGLTKTSPTEFWAHRQNFKPEEDLRILYLAPAK
jgi:hypothetical protein